MILYLNSANISRIKGGSSHSFIFTTHNEKLVIKTITSSERKQLIKILPKYCSRLVECKESKLVRIIGLFKLLPENQNFLIMENIIPHKSRAIIFDLKGSTVDRYVDCQHLVPKGTVLKDQNFIDNQMKICLSQSQVKETIQVILDDFYVLKRENIMDYSVLVGIYDKNVKCENRYFLNHLDNYYTIGVIDILQEYNFSKITEHRLKSIYKKNSFMMSVAEPDLYFQRISNFLIDIFT